MSAFALPLDHLPKPLEAVLRRYWQRLQETESQAAGELSGRLSSQPELARQLARMWAGSEYAAELCIRNPQWLVELLDENALWQPLTRKAEIQLRERLQPLFERNEPDQQAEYELKRHLRHFHQKQMLRLIWRDVCHQASIRETAGEVSLLAEISLDVTLALLYQWATGRFGVPKGEFSGETQGLIVLGMGKLGAGELNLSSDIDLMFAYPEAGETEQGVSCQQFFVRLGQQLIDALDKVTEDGFVFRVDMRLRPYGSDGVLACSFDAMENYYQLQGRDWERYAMIKARTVAGSKEAGADLLKRLRPFSYRRYLDFSAFESLRAMKRQINKQVQRKGMSEDIKLGAGGIREVEFVVQALQMVHGGRDKRLQQVSLYRAMDVLQAGSYLPESTVQALRNAYNFLRDLEHKLQGFANQQTQSLPGSPDEQLRIAVAMGIPDTEHAQWSQLRDVLDQHRAIVRQYFGEVINLDDEEDDADRHDVDDAELSELWHQEMADDTARRVLCEHGFETPDETWEQLLEFRRGKIYRTLPSESHQRFNRFMPLLLATLSHEKTPSLGFSRVMKMVEAVARRTAYLVLLAENPRAMKQFVQLCTASPFVADFLSEHPVLLDELLSVLRQPPEKNQLEDELIQGLLRIDETDFEAQMEYLRHFKQSHTLQVAAAQITRSMTVMKVSDYLTFTAEAILEQVLALCWQDLTRKHGYPVNSLGEHGEMDFVIIAYGKLGGIELSYLSDLDIVFIHGGDLNEETVTAEGQKSVNSREFYTRLAQRAITMLGTHTMSGKLYEVDMRLRPSGESGLLVTTLSGFERYQLNEAWTWEHQALVRARAVAGSQRMAREFETLRANVLSQNRNIDALATDVVNMRQRMRNELGRKAGKNAGQPSFDIKQGTGGIVDIEFIVQYLVLSQAQHHPELCRWSDNVRILESAEQSELLTGTQIHALTKAYLALRSALHEIALQYAGDEQPDQSQATTILEPLEPVRAEVTTIWQQILGRWEQDPENSEGKDDTVANSTKVSS